jgi:predicted secreted protein
MTVLALMFVFTSCFNAYAEETQPEWYALDEEESVLTITLPANETTGYAWEFEVSEPEALELATQEYVPAENSKDVVGAGGTWVASFIGTFKKFGNVDLTLNYKRSGEAEAAETRLVKLFVSENNQLQVVSAETTAPTEPAWYALDEEASVLTITLPANETTGYAWTYTISEPEALELATQEYVADETDKDGAGGTWVTSFIGTFKKFGNVDLTLNYQRSGDKEAAETRLVKLFISENNQIEVVSADITAPAATVAPAA